MNATLGLASISETSKTTPTVTYFLQKGHSFINKDTSPNSVINYSINIQTHESMGAMLIQITTPSNIMLLHSFSGESNILCKIGFQCG